MVHVGAGDEDFIARRCIFIYKKTVHGSSLPLCAGCGHPKTFPHKNRGTHRSANAHPKLLPRVSCPKAAASRLTA